VDEATIIGIDLGKRVFQIHGAGADGRPVLRKRLARAQVLPFLARQSRCVVALEACATAHFWGREIGTRPRGSPHSADLREAFR
jgi:transposase